MAFLFHILLVLLLLWKACCELGCTTSEHSAEYDELGRLCPIRFHETMYYFQPHSTRDTMREKVTHHAEPMKPEQLYCDAFCSESVPRNKSTVVYKGSPREDTVIRDLPALRRLWHRLTNATATTRLPWCRLGLDGEGYWVSRELLEKWSNSAMERDGESTAMRRLSEVMSGDLEVALTWRYVWIPTNCRTFHYNATSFGRCAAKWRQQTNSTLWIFIIGDSISRGVYCGFMRLFAKGGECEGTIESEPCNENVPIGGVIHRHYELMEYAYECIPRSFKPSYHVSFTAEYPGRLAVLTGMNGVARGGGMRGPSHLVYNSGVWDHSFHIVREETKMPVGKQKRGGRRPKMKTFVGYKQVLPTAWNPINHAAVDLMRPTHMESMLQVLSTIGYSGKFIYRSNLCTAVHDARLADERVEMVVEKYKGEVLNLYNASICRGIELMRDIFHFDRHFAKRPPNERPSVGELNVVVVQSLLNRICNPLMLSDY